MMAETMDSVTVTLAGGEGPAEGAVTTAGAGCDDRAIAQTVHDVHAGRVRTQELSPALRQQCVAHLTMEGFNNSEIAQLMRVSERTVTRDRLTVRREHALGPSRTLGDELLGELERISMASVQRLVRLARSESTPAYARLWAEEAMVRIYKQFIEMAFRLKYVEDGSRRLSDQRRLDPQEQQRERERIKMMKMAALGGSL